MAHIKTAITEFPVHELIKERWSPRAFSNESISKDELSTLFEAMSWAASASNEQPWRLIIGVKNEGETYQKVLDCLDEWNQKWAHTAPVLGVVIAKKNIKGKPNHTHAYDAGAAMATLCLQAISQDIYVHQMGGIHIDKTMAAFSIPAEEYEVMAGFAIGKLGEKENIDKYYHEMESSSRNRKHMFEFVFGEEWAKPSLSIL